jgi:hypothetical protein
LLMSQYLTLAGDGLPVVADSLAAGNGGGKQGAGQRAAPTAQSRPA